MTRERVKGLVSIVLPCSSKSAIYDFCIETLHSQTYPNIELIIVEGHNVNKNRNEGFKTSRGEYVFFLDNDIKLNADCIEKMVKTIESEPDIDIAYCHFFKDGAMNGKEVSKPWNFDELRRNNYISTMSLVRSSKFVYFDEDVARLQDWDLWLRMGRNGSKGKLINEVLFTAYYASDGISMQGNYHEWFQKVKKKNNV